LFDACARSECAATSLEDATDPSPVHCGTQLKVANTSVTRCHKSGATELVQTSTLDKILEIASLFEDFMPKIETVAFFKLDSMRAYVCNPQKLAN
jgi:hypothetical protein